MTDFKMTLQADELLMETIKDESDFRDHVQKISMTIQNQNGITSLTNFKHSVMPRKRIHHYGFCFVILSVSSSIGNILFH